MGMDLATLEMCWHQVDVLADGLGIALEPHHVGD
jgi:hypothetical protein